MKFFFPGKSVLDDRELRQFLLANDPVNPATEAYLSALESDIFARIDALPQTPSAPDAWIIDGYLRQTFSRASAFASVLLLVLGFTVGQLSVREDVSSVPYAGNLSLVAYADDASHSLSWGENDDYAE